MGFLDDPPDELPVPRWVPIAYFLVVVFHVTVFVLLLGPEPSPLATVATTAVLGVVLVALPLLVAGGTAVEWRRGTLPARLGHVGTLGHGLAGAFGVVGYATGSPGFSKAWAFLAIVPLGIAILGLHSRLASLVETDDESVRDRSRD